MYYFSEYNGCRESVRKIIQENKELFWKMHEKIFSYLIERQYFYLSTSNRYI